MSEEYKGSLAAPMGWRQVPDPNLERGMTDDEVREFLARPIEPMGRLTGKDVKEETGGEA